MSANFSSIKSLFGKGELPTVVSDSTYVLNCFGKSGFKTLCLEAVSTGDVDAPKDVLLIPAVPSIYPNLGLDTALKESAVLLVPLLAFAAGDREVDYLFNAFRRFLSLRPANET